MSQIEKRCPNGYHKDPESGRCKDPITGAFYENVQHTQELKENFEQKYPEQAKKPKKPKLAEKPIKDDNGDEYYCQNSRVFNTVTHAWQDEGQEGYEQAKKNRSALLKKIKDDDRIPKVKVKPVYVKIKDGTAVETTADDPDAKVLDGHIQTAELYGVEEIINDKGDKEMVFSEERQKVHQAIIQKFFEDKNFKKAEGREPIVLMTGGGSGTGKSSMKGKLESVVGVEPKTITIDPDEIMTDYLPEYEMCMKQNPLTSAFLCHEEASYLAYQIKRMCLEKGYDFIWDGTMKSSEKAKKNAKEFKDAGCKVVCRGIFMNPEVSWNSCEFRFINHGRYVPQSVAIGSNCSFTSNMHDEELLDMFDDVEIYYRKAHDDPGETVYSKQGDKVSVENKEHYTDLHYDVTDYNIIKSMKKGKQFKDFTLTERRSLWNTLRMALDEAGHDIMVDDVVNNLPDDEKEYMKVEQFNGITFDSNDFRDVITMHILNGNGVDVGADIDFDALIGDNTSNEDVEPALDTLPTEKNITGADSIMRKDKMKKTYRIVGYDARRDYADVLEQSRQNYQDARNPVIRYVTNRDSLEDDALGARAFDTYEDAKREMEEWAKALSADGFAFAVVDENNELVKSEMKKEEDFWDAMQASSDAEFIQEVVDNGDVIDEEENTDADVGKYTVRIIRYKDKVYRVIDFDKFPPAMEVEKSETKKSKKIAKDIGDACPDGNGGYLYVSLGGWNWHIKSLGGDRYSVVFLNGGFLGGEEYAMDEVTGLNEAYDVADKYGVLFDATQKSKKDVRVHKGKVAKTFDMQRGEDGRYNVGGDTHIRVYQIGRDMAEKLKDDGYKDYYKFMDWEFAQNHGFSKDHYTMVWEGDLDVHGSPEGVYMALQDYRPIETSRVMHSLSMSDIVEIDGKFYYCDDFGFKDVTAMFKSKDSEYIRNPNIALQKCLDYQMDNRLIGLTHEDVMRLTGNDPEELMRNMVNKGRVQKVHTSDGYVFRFRM